MFKGVVNKLPRGLCSEMNAHHLAHMLWSRTDDLWKAIHCLQFSDKTTSDVNTEVETTLSVKPSFCKILHTRRRNALLVGKQDTLQITALHIPASREGFEDFLNEIILQPSMWGWMESLFRNFFFPDMTCAHVFINHAFLCDYHALKSLIQTRKRMHGENEWSKCFTIWSTGV